MEIKAIICDWAGTTIDFGCMAPVMVFVEVFKQYGIEITLDEARTPMGLAKRDHIKALMEMPRIKELWKEVHNHNPEQKETDLLYSKLEPLLAKVVRNHSDIIPGTLELQEFCRTNNIKFGTTTGYVQSMMHSILPLANTAGFNPDSVVASDDVPEGRPAPYMIYENMKRMQVYPAGKIVKIGDTVADIKEGINAGAWTIGLTLSGNETGLPLHELKKISEKERNVYRENATKRLKDAGAHYICDGIWEVIPILETISYNIKKL